MSSSAISFSPIVISPFALELCLKQLSQALVADSFRARYRKAAKLVQQPHGIYAFLLLKREISFVSAKMPSFQHCVLGSYTPVNSFSR